MDKADKEKFRFKDFDILLYTWKGGGKKVFLIHGWEGQAGNSSLFEFSELVGVLLRKYRAKLLISHSFGGITATYALYNNQDLQIDKYVLLTVPDKFIERINDVSEQVGLSNKVKKTPN